MIEEVNRYKTAELRKKLKKYKNEVKEMKDLFVDFIDLSGITYKQAEELMENRITINKLRNWKKNRNREDNNYGGAKVYFIFIKKIILIHSKKEIFFFHLNLEN